MDYNNKSQQIFPVSAAAPCQSYLCRNKVRFGIGKSKKYSVANIYFCDQCLKEVATAMPAELLVDNPLVVELNSKIITDNDLSEALDDYEKKVQDLEKSLNESNSKVEALEQELAKLKVTNVSKNTQQKAQVKANSKGGKR
jgi:TolA-binding protein